MIHFHRWSPWEDGGQVLVHRGSQAKFPTKVTVYQEQHCLTCGIKTYRKDTIP